MDALAVDEAAVGGAEIHGSGGSTFSADFKVLAGDARVIDKDVRFG
jgi:hypothetical protein